MREKAIVQGFSSDLEGRNRDGLVWYLVFLSSTIVGILALIALMLNIINGAFGYVAYDARVDPDTLAVGGVPIDEQSKEQLMTLLQSKLSSGAYNKLEKEKSFESRSREDVYTTTAFIQAASLRFFSLKAARRLLCLSESATLL